MTPRFLAGFAFVAFWVVLLGFWIRRELPVPRIDAPAAVIPPPPTAAAPSPATHPRGIWSPEPAQSVPELVALPGEVVPPPPAEVRGPGYAVVYGQVVSFRAPSVLRAGTLTLYTAGFNTPLFASRYLTIRVPRAVFGRVRGLLGLSIPRGRLVIVRVRYLPGAPYGTLIARGITATGAGFRVPESNETAGAEDYGPGAGPGPTSGGS